MSAFITLSRLSWATPDGRPLFSDIDLALGPERTGLVGRNGVGKSTLLRLIAGDLQPGSGSVSVRGRLGVMRQTVRADASEHVADLFGARDGLALLRRAGLGEASAAELAQADWTLETRIEAALAGLGLGIPSDTPLSGLSGGQRTRAALAALVFARPDFLLLDEPTNDLDREGRDAVAALLAGWRGGALVVSHDRALLEAMEAIVELTAAGVGRYGGGWSAYRARRELDLAAAEHDLVHAEKEVAAAARAAQQAAERKARKDSAGAREAARGDAPRILLGARRNRSEATGGVQARLAERRRTEAGTAAAAARERIEALRQLRVALAPTRLAANRRVVTATRVTAGYASDAPVLRDLSLEIVGPERVAVVGPNGAGKSTLLRLLTGALRPSAGEVGLHVPFALLDQRVSLLDPGATIRDNFRRLNPGEDENACRAALARFQFRTDAALQPVRCLSGGQMLRAGLACVLGGRTPPSLLMLDEPTNHLDIDSIEAVEGGLAAYDGALLVVSHDERFLEAIGIERHLALAEARG
ncbi:ABC-F family ATP-binding cassette domain-containing protein [Methylobacterium oxalidis]|uniref:ATP-binding protein n=1 Tax=Methylobacterium oxalidis TaxID=944322 RepID=A0A512IZH0_9HYPH|nr:ABC-F family ATP-binding cassette domain-containing protein [Methylobacterium oxalidis]GEP03019.1 ATP-binding protein [Methylobacterium oxalidis]GJE31703.1 putative ABC transporter ATP-binding protein YheS [Methylobacterium oxalidis]GLS65952.1 ATP-binding protein [Methylobacterium oxalidis]